MTERDGMHHRGGQVAPWLWHLETRGVITPSDFLTEEERQKLSGPVVTYMLASPMKDKPGQKPPVQLARPSPAPQPTQTTQPVQPATPAGSARPDLTRDAMADLLRQGRSTTQLARIFGVSRGTINNRKRAWGLRRQAERHPDAASPPEEKHVRRQIEVSEALDAPEAEKLLKNLAAFVLADGGRYQLTLCIRRQAQ